MPISGSHRLAGAAVVALDIAVLRIGWVAPKGLMTHLVHPRRWVTAVGTDAATLELARIGFWLVGLWLALAVVAVLGSGLPGAFGRIADGVAGHAVPAVLRRTIAAALGASVVLVPVAAGASTTGANGPTTATTATTAATASSRAGTTHLSGGWPWPTSMPTSAQPGAPTAAPASGAPGKPVPWPRSATPVPSAPAPSSSDVVVRAGDCLWAIAAHRLGPHASARRIATETRRWYEANAATIGPDAGLIHPGQLLHQPTEKGR